MLLNSKLHIDRCEAEVNLIIEDIYFFEVNTKYISSNVLKISAFSRMRSKSEIDDIFST